MQSIFYLHLSTNYDQYFDPFDFWHNQQNELSEVTCRILSIACSETPVERLFGGLSFMYDSSANRMKDDLIDADMRIRMTSVFEHSHEFYGNMLERLKIWNDYFHYLAFQDIPIDNAE